MCDYDGVAEMMMMMTTYFCKRGSLFFWEKEKKPVKQEYSED